MMNLKPLMNLIIHYRVNPMYILLGEGEMFLPENHNKPITREDKVNYLRIALNLQNIGIDIETADRIIETYETISILKDDFTIKDAAKIKVKIDEKYKDK